MAATSYRDLQRPTLLETGISQGNAGLAATRLADTFKEFENIGLQVGGQMRADQGQREGAAAGSDPQFRKGFLATTAYGQAYNNAALRSYLIQQEADADETAARLEMDAGTDPEKFKATFGAVKEKVMLEADPLARPFLEEAYTRRLTSGSIRLMEAQNTEIRNEQRMTTKMGIVNSVERIGRLRNTDPVMADEEKQKLMLMLEGAQNDGTYSPAEITAMRREAETGLIAQEISGQFAKVFDEGGDPGAFIEKLKKSNAESEALTTDEENQVVDKLFAEWRERNAVTAARKSAAVDAAAESVLGVYTSAGQDSGTSALSRLSGVPDELKSDVRDKVLTGLNQRRLLAREQNVDTLTSIARAEATGTASEGTYVDVDRMYEAGAYTPEQYANQLAQLDASRIRRAGDVSVAADVENSLLTGMPLDPTNPAIKKAVDSAFSVRTAGLEEGSPEWQATALAFGTRTRMLPPRVISWAERNRRSPNPEVALPAAQFISSVQATAPEAIDGIDERSRAFSAIVTESIGTGGDPEKSLEMARRIVYDTDKEVLDRLDTQYRETRKTSNGALDNFIDKDFDFEVFGQPTAGLDMQAAFDSQTSKYFKLVNGDVDQARELAWRDLKSVYGVSEVNGVKQMMMQPPEKFGVTREQVQTELTGMLASSPQRDGSTAADLILVADSLTQRAAVDLTNGLQIQPSYKVLTKTGDLLTDARGRPVRYFLPSTEELSKNIETKRAEAEAKAKADLEQMRKYRDLRRETEEIRANDWTIP